jgi:hypothetical protein
MNGAGQNATVTFGPETKAFEVKGGTNVKIVSILLDLYQDHYCEIVAQVYLSSDSIDVATANITQSTTSGAAGRADAEYNFTAAEGSSYSFEGYGRKLSEHSTTPDWQNNGSVSCYETCNTYHVQQDYNWNSATYGQTRQGSVIAYNTTDCGGCCGQSTTPSWTDEGAAYCEDCVSKQLQRDTNGCSETWNQTRVINAGSACDYSNNYEDTGNTRCTDCVNEKEQWQTNLCGTDGYHTTRWVAGGSACNYVANYSNVIGTIWYCPGNTPVSAEVFLNTNDCFTGNQWYANGNTYADNPSNTEDDIAEVYYLSPCGGGSGYYTIPYCKGTFAINDRIVISEGDYFTIEYVTTVENAGSYSAIATGETGCPQVYTIMNDYCGAYPSDTFYALGIVPGGNYLDNDYPYTCFNPGSQVYSLPPGAIQLVNYNTGLCNCG